MKKDYWQIEYLEAQKNWITITEFGLNTTIINKIFTSSYNKNRRSIIFFLLLHHNKSWGKSPIFKQLIETDELKNTWIRRKRANWYLRWHLWSIRWLVGGGNSRESRRASCAGVKLQFDSLISTYGLLIVMSVLRNTLGAKGTAELWTVGTSWNSGGGKRKSVVGFTLSEF